MSRRLYMVIERFRDGDPTPVYRRLRDHGRLVPEGVSYLSSWVDESLECCYQVMEAQSREILDDWIARWNDIVDFEVHPVISSADAAALRAARPRTGRPAPGEYADYADADIAAVPGDDAIVALVELGGRTPALFRALAAAAERGVTYDAGKWTLKEVLGHLIDDERIFAYRLLCVARGEERELEGFDEKRYAAHGGFELRPLEDLLAEYETTRAETLALLRGLPSAAWDRRGRVNGYGCSVRGLAFHIAGHELHHHRIVHERYVPLARPHIA